MAISEMNYTGVGGGVTKGSFDLYGQNATKTFTTVPNLKHLSIKGTSKALSDIHYFIEFDTDYSISQNGRYFIHTEYQTTTSYTYWKNLNDAPADSYSSYLISVNTTTGEVTLHNPSNSGTNWINNHFEWEAY